MGSELLRMADGFAMVAQSLREMVEQAGTETKAETVKESKGDKGINGAEADKKKVEKKIAVEDIRAALAQKSQDGKSKEIKELLGKYGVAKLSAVKAEDYPALFQEAKVL